MRVLLRLDSEPGDWDLSLLESRIAGLPLLSRHLLAFRGAGVSVVELWASLDDERIEGIVERCQVPGVVVRLCRGEKSNVKGPEGVVEQRADTLVDPRLVAQLLRRAGQCSVVCVDRYAGNYPVELKSPYVVGVADAEEAREASGDSEQFTAIGLALRGEDGDGSPIPLDVGRFYWHRFRRREDAAEATTKVFLATMKATDGMFARTNRRVSIPISKALVNTGVTPNAVTLVGLAASGLAGALFAVGSYDFMFVGSLMSWFASMLDGVDGELARARFQTSDFGSWLETVCDYLYYLFILCGMGIGLYRTTQDPLWLVLGGGSALGVILSFWVVAGQRKQYARKGDVAAYGLAFQRAVGSHAANPFYSFLRRCTFLSTRAALPYFIVVFAALGLVDLVLVFMFVGAHLAWTLASYAGRLRFV